MVQDCTCQKCTGITIWSKKLTFGYWKNPSTGQWVETFLWQEPLFDGLILSSFQPTTKSYRMLEKTPWLDENNFPTLRCVTLCPTEGFLSKTATSDAFVRPAMDLMRKKHASLTVHCGSEQPKISETTYPLGNYIFLPPNGQVGKPIRSKNAGWEGMC